MSQTITMMFALYLYRTFVFDVRPGFVTRQTVLFVSAYLAFVPVTWGLSLATEGPLLLLLPADGARFVAHLIGLTVPVLLNFAFNKLVTFRDGPAVRSVIGWTGRDPAGYDRARPMTWALPALICIYAGAVAVIGISGDFPLNDDWSYASTMREFARTGVFTPSSWSSIPLLTEILVAFPVCKATGCGADDLRVVTLLASVALFSAVFVLVAGRNRRTSIPLLAAATVAFNPIALTLALTFMSDTLFAALMTVAAVLFIRSFERPSTSLAVLGTGAALAATLTRQLGICIPLAYLAVALVQMAGAGTSWRRSLPALLPMATCVAALVILKQWLLATGRLPALYDIKSNILLETLHSPVASLMRVGHNLSIILNYMGLFALPVLLATRPPPVPRAAGRWISRGPRLAATLAIALAIADLFSLHRLMPSGGNILTPQGVGPLLLRDTAILGLGSIPPLPSTFWLVVTLLGLLGAFLLVERLSARVLAFLPLLVPVPPGAPRVLDAAQKGSLFVAIAALAYLAPLLLIPFYDRYLIPLLPLTFFLLADGAPSFALRHRRSASAAALCLLVSGYAVLGVHDYMAWNRARWRAIADLEATSGIGAGEIDGGMEYNGLRAYRADYTVQSDRSWWWVDKDLYQVTFEAVAGLEMLARYPYTTYLPPAERSIKVLKKAP